MNIFDIVVLVIILLGLLAWGALAVFARGMSDVPLGEQKEKLPVLGGSTKIYAILAALLLIVGLVAGSFFVAHHISKLNQEIGIYKTQQKTLVTQNKALSDKIAAQNKSIDELNSKKNSLQKDVDSSTTIISELEEKNKDLANLLAHQPPPDDSDCKAQLQWLRNQEKIITENVSW